MRDGRSWYRMLSLSESCLGVSFCLLEDRITYQDPLGKERKWESAERLVGSALSTWSVPFMLFNFLELFL